MINQPCPKCGKVHAALSSAQFATLRAANSRFGKIERPDEPKRASAKEAMEWSKSFYKETLDYLA